MVKQLIPIVTFLLIQNTLRTIYYNCAILDFTMLVWYLLHNNKIFNYIEFVLYRLNKTKIIFKNYCQIEAKLFQPTLNYPNFFTMIYFIKYI